MKIASRLRGNLETAELKETLVLDAQYQARNWQGLEVKSNHQ